MKPMPQLTRVSQSAIAAVKSDFEVIDFTCCFEYELPTRDKGEIEGKERSTVGG